jgi:hypothetical protein
MTGIVARSPSFSRFPIRLRRRRNVARLCCETFPKRGGDSLALRRIWTMIRSVTVAGFGVPAESIACPRHIVAASLAMASLSICLIIALAVISIRIGMAIWIPA